jgi:hypothetical protein
MRGLNPPSLLNRYLQLECEYCDCGICGFPGLKNEISTPDLGTQVCSWVTKSPDEQVFVRKLATETAG